MDHRLAIPGIVAQASTFNTLQVHSVDDQIEGFGRGISAVAGRRASGPRTNEYFDSWNPSMTNLGAGNRLIVTGNLSAFTMTNDGLVAPPPAGFFTASR